MGMDGRSESPDQQIFDIYANPVVRSGGVNRKLTRVVTVGAGAGIVQ